VAFNRSLCVVNQAKGGICGAVVVVGSELRVGEDVIGVGVRENVAGNNLLKEFSTTFEEADGAIGFGEAVVGFVWFWDDDNQCVFPRMESEGDGRVED